MSQTYPLPSEPPTLSGFQAWAYSAMGIPETVIPPGSQWFSYAFNVAVSVVSTQLACAAGPIYMLAVYNLGGDNLINWAQDPSPPVLYPGTNEPYLQHLRAEFKINNFVPGVVSSSGDETTNTSLEVIAALKELTIGQLGNLKTPWGRQYLAFAQDTGPIWGLS